LCFLEELNGVKKRKGKKNSRGGSSSSTNHLPSLNQNQEQHQEAERKLQPRNIPIYELTFSPLDVGCYLQVWLLLFSRKFLNF